MYYIPFCLVIIYRMKFTVILTTLLLIFVLTSPDECFAKKKKSKKAGKSTTSGSTKIDSKTLKCLVCRATVNEYAWAVLKVDPKKMVDTGTWRLDENGESKRQIVSTTKLNKVYCIIGEGYSGSISNF